MADPGGRGGRPGAEAEGWEKGLCQARSLHKHLLGGAGGGPPLDGELAAMTRQKPLLSGRELPSCCPWRRLGEGAGANGSRSNGTGSSTRDGEKSGHLQGAVMLTFSSSGHGKLTTDFNIEKGNL